MNLPPYPLRDAIGSSAWLAWHRDLQKMLTSADSISWAIVDKQGSTLLDITDRLFTDLQFVSSHLSSIESRPHSDLQAIDGSGTHHISASEHTDLTDAGDTTLHYHASDRDRANHTGTQSHASISGLGGAAELEVGTTAGTVAAGDDSRFLSTTDKTDLTDGGTTTLHKHDIGSITTAAAVLDTTRYVTVVIAGNSYKLALIV